MDVSLKWLKDYVDLTAPADELAHRLTMAGVEVEEIERIGADWEKVFVGKVVALRPHPNADNLQLVDVDYGEERRATVVTGAKNLEVGNVVPLAQLGARLANYRKPGNPIEELKPRDLRGIVSQGMVCSAVELGLGEESDGIMHLDPSARIGAPLAEELGDVIFHLKVTPNRSDCLAMLGVAREIAAITGRQSRQPDVAVAEPGAPAADAVTVRIDDPELCPRYIAKIIRGVKIGPSPKWLQDRLVAGGMRPINNVVDVTNYVMLELGQPLHAFDYDKIGGRQIVVRRAQPGERLTTLDGVDRELTPEMLVIADATIPVALAGVMGGADSEVSDATTTVLLESASFHPVSVRRTARELRLPSEASRRFERTVPTENALPAARRAAQLIAELSGGAVAAGEVDAYPRPAERRRVRLELAEIRRLLGVDFAPAEVERILGALGFTLRRDGDAYDVGVPPYRVDVSRPADLVEELVRIRGYDVIPETLPTGAIPEPLPDDGRRWLEQARDVLVAAGLSEIITYSLTSRQRLSRLIPAVDPSPLAAGEVGTGGTPTPVVDPRFVTLEAQPLLLLNPMTPENECMRTSALSHALETLRDNLRHQSVDVGLFEIGKIYLPRPDDLPDEVPVLTVVLGGHRGGRELGQRGETDFFDAKGIAEVLLDRLGVAEVRFVPGTHPTLHPGRTAFVVLGGAKQPSWDDVVGVVGEVDWRVRDAFEIENQRVYLVALDLARTLPHATSRRQIVPLSKFPPVEQDLAVVVDESAAAEAVRRAILAAGRPLVTSARVFDVYTGDQVGAGKKSLAFSLTFQSAEKTLSEGEVRAVRDRIVKSLTHQFGAQLRG